MPEYPTSAATMYSTCRSPQIHAHVLVSLSLCRKTREMQNTITGNGNQAMKKKRRNSRCILDIELLCWFHKERSVQHLSIDHEAETMSQLPKQLQFRTCDSNELCFFLSVRSGSLRKKAIHAVYTEHSMDIQTHRWLIPILFVEVLSSRSLMD